MGLNQTKFAWGDKEIELYIVQVPFKGEEVDAIRVRKPEWKEAKPEPPKTEEKEEEPRLGF
jgi:hypothetical protein